MHVDQEAIAALVGVLAATHLLEPAPARAASRMPTPAAPASRARRHRRAVRTRNALRPGVRATMRRDATSVSASAGQQSADASTRRSHRPGTPPPPPPVRCAAGGSAMPAAAPADAHRGAPAHGQRSAAAAAPRAARAPAPAIGRRLPRPAPAQTAAGSGRDPGQRGHAPAATITPVRENRVGSEMVHSSPPWMASAGTPALHKRSRANA